MEGLLKEEAATIPPAGRSSLHGQVIKGFRCHLSGDRPPNTHRCQFLGVVLDPGRSRLEPAGATDSHCAPAAACPPPGRPETGLTLWTPHMQPERVVAVLTPSIALFQHTFFLF